MSRNDLGPEWDNEELDWLNDLLEEKAAVPDPAPAEAPRPAEPEPAFVREEPVPSDFMDFEKEPAEEIPTPRRSAPRQETPRQEPPRRSATAERPAAPKRARAQSVPPAVSERQRAESTGRPAYRRRRRSNAPMMVLIVVLALGMVFSAWQLGKIFLNYHKDRTAYSDLIDSAVTAKPTAAPAPTPEAQTADAPAPTPFVSEIPLEVDWDMLRSINSDVVGWLYCPGTIINYPVVQAADNEFYLNHGFDRQSNTAGALFVDMDSALGVVQSNYIIYGHNMKDNSMFGTFKEYMDERYLAQNPSMYYLTPNVCYRVDLFGIHIVEGTIDNYPVFFGSLTEYQGYIDRISSSFYWFKRELQTTDYQLMTLSTCTSAAGYSDARLVLHGVMVPIQ